MNKKVIEEILNNILGRMECKSETTKYGIELSQEECELLANYIADLQRKEYNNSKAIEYINNKWKKDKYYEDIENCMTFCKYDKDDLLNILEKGE